MGSSVKRVKIVLGRGRFWGEMGIFCRGKSGEGALRWGGKGMDGRVRAVCS